MADKGDKSVTDQRLKMLLEDPDAYFARARERAREAARRQVQSQVRNAGSKPSRHLGHA